MSTRALSATISTFTPDGLQETGDTGSSTTSVATDGAALKRSVPIGWPRKLLRSSSASSMSRKAGSMPLEQTLASLGQRRRCGWCG
jgi:hypothetical protein